MNLPPKERMCHRTAFTQSCRGLVTDGKCDRWMQVQGHNPNTGEPVNNHNCIDDWLPMLLIENSQMQRQTAAAVESFRNEMVKANSASLMALIAIAQAEASGDSAPRALPY